MRREPHCVPPPHCRQTSRRSPGRKLQTTAAARRATSPSRSRPAEKAAKLSAKNLELIEEIADRTAFIKEHVDAMIEARKVANKIECERSKAIAYHDTIVPAMEEIRYHIDKLELIVDNQMWTLPKYRELLFIR